MQTPMIDPDCDMGYTKAQVKEIMGPRLGEFWVWMDGQTMAVCPDHGGIVYESDVRRFTEQNSQPQEDHDWRHLLRQAGRNRVVQSQPDPR